MIQKYELHQAPLVTVFQFGKDITYFTVFKNSFTAAVKDFYE